MPADGSAAKVAPDEYLIAADGFWTKAGVERLLDVIEAAKAYVAAHEKYSSNRAWGTKTKNDDSLARSYAHLRLVRAVEELGT